MGLDNYYCIRDFYAPDQHCKLFKLVPIMTDILYKGIDERQSVTHAKGTIGGRWVFGQGTKEIPHKEITGLTTITSLFKAHIVHRWVASYSLGWKVTIPAGCDSGNGEQVMALVKEELIRIYPEG